MPCQFSKQRTLRKWKSKRCRDHFQLSMRCTQSPAALAMCQVLCLGLLSKTSYPMGRGFDHIGANLNSGE
eukprot:2816463-Amphidinium_carterae.2